MLTLLPYICSAVYLGFVTRSVALPVLAYMLYHFCFYLPVFGTGLVSELEFGTYYTLAFAMHALVGYVLAWGLNVPPLLMGPKFHGSCTVACPEHQKIIKHHRAESILPYLYRGAMSMIVFMLIIGATLFFEFLPISLWWLWFIIALVVVGAAFVVFFFAFTRRGPPMWLKYRQAVYIHKNNKQCVYCWDDMTAEVVIWLVMFYIVSIPLFCVLFAVVPSFWQFYIACITFGVFFLAYGIVSIVVKQRKHFHTKTPTQ